MARYKSYQTQTSVKAVPWMVLSIAMLLIMAVMVVFPNNTSYVYQNADGTYSVQQSGAFTSFKQLTDKVTSTAQGKVLAVRSDNNKGVMGFINIEVKPGTGRLLVDTSPFIEIDTQLSANTALSITQNYTQLDLSNRDVTISFDVESQVVGGPSAGASMTLALISAITKKQLNPEAAITGTIEEDGSIGAVGGILEKAEAAATSGAKIFIVPKGQSNFTYYEQRIEQQDLGFFRINRVVYVPKTVDVNKYTMENWNMTTIEVANIEEAAKYMLE